MAKKKSKKSKDNRRVELHYVNAAPGGTGILGSIKKLLPEETSEQFLVGLLLGAGAAYVLSDEALRRHILRYAVQTYGSMVGGFEEMKEQFADVQAEVLAEQAAAS